MMRIVLVGLLSCCLQLTGWAQVYSETNSTLQQEWQAEERPELVEEEDIQQAIWQERRRYPLDINRADSMDWMEFGVLSSTQVHQILTYRSLFGRFIDVHELQAVPGISLPLLRMLRPWIYVASVDQTIQPVSVSHQLLLRLSGGTRSSGFQQQYGGLSMQAVLRYRFRSRDWQAGFLAEQDAGERWRKFGADFYSFFLSRQRPGSPVRWIIGDYQFSFGQGLLIGQQIGGNRSIYPEQLIRSPQGLEPYRGIGEFAFFRGVALRWRKHRNALDFFASYRKLDGSFQEDSTGFSSVSTLYTTGIRRTEGELARRGNLSLLTTGASWNRSFAGLTMGALWIRHQLGQYMQASDHPRNRYAFYGRVWMGTSLYARGEWRNWLYAAEWVWSSQRRMALQAAATWSLDRRFDLSVVFRHASPGYTAWFGQALSASSRFTNETGLLTAVVFRWSKRWESGFFVDRWQHPWMRYLAHFPSVGGQWQLQTVYRPKRSVQWTMVYRETERMESESGETPRLPLPQPVLQRQFRVALQVDEWVAWRWRIRGAWNQWRPRSGAVSESGLAWSAELRWQPPMKPWRVQFQWMSSRVSAYDARVYIQQADLPGLNQLAMLDQDGQSMALVIQYQFSGALRLNAMARRGHEATQIIDRERFILVGSDPSWFWRFQVLFSPGSRSD